MRVNPLFAACSTWETDEVEKLVKSKADVNVTNTKGDTPLIVAARSRQRSMKLLIDAGADVNHRNKAGESALDVAMSDDVRNHGAGVALLEAGATVGQGKKVFDSIRQCECTSNHPIVMRWCKEKRLDHSEVADCINGQRVEDNRNRFYACEEGYFDKHSMRGGCIYARDECGHRLLMCNMRSWRSFCYAVSYDDFDVNCYPDKHGYTVLHHAVMGGSRKVLREVLKKGPDYTAVDNEGKTAMMTLQAKRKSKYDGNDDSDDDCWTSWGEDPLNVKYGEKDSLIEMLKKYVCAKEAEQASEASDEADAKAPARKRKRRC